VVDLRARGCHTCLVPLLEHVRRHQRREQRDDGHHHQHLNQRDAGLPSLPSALLSHRYTANSFIPVIAKSMLRISAPTMTPMIRITMGSKMEVKRLIAERVSVS